MREGSTDLVVTRTDVVADVAGAEQSESRSGARGFSIESLRVALHSQGGDDSCVVAVALPRAARNLQCCPHPVSNSR